MEAAVREDEGLWRRVVESKVVAALGRLPEPPPEIQLIRVSCEVAPAALRPLLEARRLTEAILGETRPGRRPRVRTLFGEAQERATEAVLLDLWNRLAQQRGGRWVVVFDAVELADEATLAALVQIVRRSQWLLLPLALVFRSEPRGAGAELLAAVRGLEGEVVLRAEAPAAAEAPAIEWRALPPKVLQALRAGALIGPGFEVKVLAELVGAAPERVLSRLQRAIDLGVPLEDRGEGRFSLPSSALSALSASIMPSLAQAWHRQLGRLLGARAVQRVAPPPPPPVDAARLARLRAERLADARVADIIDLSHEVVDEVGDVEGVVAGALGATEREVVGEADAARAAAHAEVAGSEVSQAAPAGPTSDGAAAVPSAPATEAASDATTRASAEPGGGAGADAAGAGREAGRGSGEAADAAASGGPTSPAQIDGAADAATEGGGTSPAARGGASVAGADGATQSGAATAARRGEVAGRPVQRRTVMSPPAQGGRAARPKTLMLSPEVDLPPPAEAPPVAREAADEGDPMIDKVRAAEHMRLAGDFESAAAHLCEAARAAGEAGAPQAAVQHASAALALLEVLPAGVRRQRLKARALLELGRVQWQAPGFEHGFTLAQARVTLESARAELDPDAPLELVVDLAQALAGVHFDLGDGPSLARAQAELEEAGRRLQAEGDAIGAAALFNDQAAVLIRMGAAKQALRLLRASRAVFDARVQVDPGALRELADSEHLFAQLPLHARMQLGREEEGYAVGLDHALAAERLLRELGDARELARVWETIGRLELKRLRIDEARRRLEAAYDAQSQLGDLTGLAQTTEFLSEVLGWCGLNAEAVALLRDSVVHNRDKGSPYGLQSNRRALAALSARFARLPERAEGLREVEILLAAGERELGLVAPAEGSEAGPPADGAT